MENVRIKLFAVEDGERFEAEIEKFLAKIKSLNGELVDIKYSSTVKNNGCTLYSALIIYRA